jgi:acyltransferase
MGRLTYVDTAKFLAIYFVIISHCSMSSHIAHFLFSFHVPLFFVLYGYVHRIRENETIRCWLYGGGRPKT